jgi:hypothetical protein
MKEGDKVYWNGGGYWEEGTVVDFSALHPDIAYVEDCDGNLCQKIMSELTLDSSLYNKQQERVREQMGQLWSNFWYTDVPFFGRVGF